MSKVIQGAVAVAILVSAFYMMFNDGGNLNPGCAIASNSDSLPKCDYDPNYHGED
jgi:hypothetical protein